MNNGNGKSQTKTLPPHLTPGNPGNVGGGRPRNEFRLALQAILEQPKVRKAVEKILGNPNHPQFATLWGKAAAFAYGQPTQPIQHQGLGPLTMDERRARIAALLGN